MAKSGPKTNDLKSTLAGGSDSHLECSCDLCLWEGDHVEAYGYCCDCKEYLCKDCYRVHLKPKPMRHHVLLDKHQMPKDQQQSQGKDICTEACIEHKNKTVEYYCATHDQLGCGVCMTISHRNCEGVGYIPEVTTSMLGSQEYKEMQDKQAKKTTQDQGKVSETYHSNALKAMKQFRNDMNEAWDKLEHKLGQEADKIKTEDMKKIHTTETKYENILQDLQALESNISSLENTCNHQYCQVFIAMKRARGEIEASLCEKENEIKVKCFIFQPVRQAMELLQGLENMATLDDIKDQPNPSAFQQAPDSALQDVLASNHVVSSANTTAVQTRDLRKIYAHHIEDICVKSRSDINIPSVIGSVLLQPDKLVVLDHHNKSVKLIDLAQHSIVSELECSQYIWDIAQVSTDQVAVTSFNEKSVSILNVGCQLTHERDVKVNGYCRGIACIKDRLIVTYFKPAKVEILDMNGKVLQTLVTVDEGKEIFQSPCYIAVSTDNQTVYVSDSRKGTVTSLGMDGQVKAIYKDEDLDCPRNLAVDQTGSVYVCGMYSENIHQLTADCTKVQILLTKSGGLKFPWSVAYCKASDKLYIGMQDDNEIHVYQLK